MPQTAMPPAPETSTADRPTGVFDGIRSRFKTADGNLDVSGLAKSALPFLAIAARRIPIGLAVVGVAAAGIALANPKTRARVADAGRRGLNRIRHKGHSS